MLEARDLCVGYRDKHLLYDVSLQLTPGRMHVLLGPNGSGKTTLLRVLARIFPPLSGTVLLDESPMGSYTTRSLARRLAILPQERTLPAMTVQTLVTQGRFPHRFPLSPLTASDRKAVSSALARCGIEHLRWRNLTTLSGGERQRVFLALTLAQDAEVILLDEPTTFLDIAQQLEILALLRSLCSEGKTILAILHDLSLALRFADTVHVLCEHTLVTFSSAGSFFDSGILERVFGVHAHRFHEGEEFFSGFSLPRS